MCTVTYVPQATESEPVYVLSSNRDERPQRSTRDLDREVRGGQEVLFPRDAAAGGTWIAVADSNRAICLLNGAFERHHRNPPYRLSRGIMALEFFEFENVARFIEGYEFENMEPFTLIAREPEHFEEVRWDGEKIHQKKLDPDKRHIWSSAPLYDPSMQKLRQQWFEQWARKGDFSLAAIRDFHQNAGVGDPFIDVVIDRLGIVKTVSTTNIVNFEGRIDVHYRELDQHAYTTKAIHLNNGRAPTS